MVKMKYRITLAAPKATTYEPMMRAWIKHPPRIGSVRFGPHRSGTAGEIDASICFAFLFHLTSQDDFIDSTAGRR